jgi:hypothetical protein
MPHVAINPTAKIVDIFISRLLYALTHTNEASPNHNSKLPIVSRLGYQMDKRDGV